MILGAVAAICVLGGRGAYAAPDSCTPITSVPTTINSSGVYCFTGNLTLDVSPNSAAISVNASSVVIDLEGYRLKETDGVSNWGVGIEVNSGAVNVVIRNGFVSQFVAGVVSEGRGTIVEDMRVANTIYGILMYEEEAIIRRNYCRLNGIGIEVWGGSAHVFENDIDGQPGDQSATNNGNGININGDNALVVGNRMSRLDVGVELSYGSGKYRDNLTTNVTDPYRGGTDAGNND
jgi:hypothetical protein